LRELFLGSRGRVAAGLLVAEFVAATQGLVIAAIMPRVVADLHGLAVYPLAFGAFFAAFFLFLPFGGPWTDRYGARRMLAIALGVLALGLGLVAIAPTMPAFVGARFVEGIGDAIDYAVSFAIVAKTFPDPLRARMLALTSAAWVVPAIAGPGLGAYVAMTFGWRWTFAGFLPLIAACAALLLPVVENRPAAERAGVFGSLQLLFSRSTLRAAPGLHGSFAAFFFLHAAFFGADAYVALMLTSVRGFSLGLASLCITLGAVGWSATAAFTPGLVARFGRARVVAAGGTLCLLGTLGLAAVTAGLPSGWAFAACAVSGAGIGLGYPTISVAAFGYAEEGAEGVVSSATLLAGVAGVLFGVLACGLSLSAGPRLGIGLQPALLAAFLVAALCALAAVALARRISPRSRDCPE
jgi:predicted MFS family arabinose efflux permease